MNRERAKELLPIIQAFAEGKEIQYFDGTYWVECERMFIDSPTNDKYRIKPKPEVIYVNKTNSGTYVHSNKEDAFAGATDGHGEQVGEWVAKKFIAADE